MPTSAITLALCALLVLGGCTDAKVRTIKIDSTKEMSGGKVAIADINPQMPEDWDGYNYVVVEMKISTSQRFYLGFNTSHGYDEVRIHSYVPGQWNRLAIPLVYYREQPSSAHDMAATYNKPRYTGWINLGGNVGPMKGIDSLGVRMRCPIGDQTFQIRDIFLSVDDPGDTYLGDRPALDEFGQSNLVDWPGKIRSMEQLAAEWKAEDEEEVSAEDLFGYSKFGGFKTHRLDSGTGFFRTALVDGKWWFVDPEGYLFLSVGVDCVYNSGGGRVRDIDRREGMLEQLPPEKFVSGRGGRSADYAAWNLERRYGEDSFEAASANTFKRMDKWGVNTIGNWSDKRLEQMGRKAFMCTFYPAGVEYGLLGLGNVYEPGFEKELEKSLEATILPNRDNPWLIGYFMGNEPVWVGQEQRVCDLILEGKDRGIRTALQTWLKEKGDSRESRKDFVMESFRKYIKAIKAAQLKLDPNHLCLGYRFGDINAVRGDLMKICAEVFDVLSFNRYELAPEKGMMDRALEESGLPMIIGEFHFGSVDRGQGQSLWQVDSQQERGVAYRYYVENAFSHPALIGTAYFTWYDQDILGRGDGENYNCGCIDVTDRPYKEQTEAMAASAGVLYDVHRGAAPAYSQKPLRARGNDHGPDEW